MNDHKIETQPETDSGPRVGSGPQPHDIAGLRTHAVSESINGLVNRNDHGGAAGKEGDANV